MAGSAVAVSLVLFDEDDLVAGRSTHEIPLSPVFNRTGDVWHIALPSLRQDLLYGGCLLASGHREQLGVGETKRGLTCLKAGPRGATRSAGGRSPKELCETSR